MDTTKTIAIYGKSGHGKVLYDIAKARGFTKILWIDDDPKKEALSFLNFYEFYHQVPILLGIGNNKVRHKLFLSLKSKGFSLPSLAHPSAIISSSAEIGEACVIMPHVVINADAKIGTASIINTASIVEHDCVIGDFVHISPKVALAGNVKVGNLSYIGLGANIIQGIDIGENTIVGAGACVVNNLSSNLKVVGIPAKEMKKSQTK